MREFEVTQNALARAMGVPPRRINEIVLGKRAITADTAVRLEATMGMPARFWMALQAEYDVERCRERLMRAGWRPEPLPELYGGAVPLDNDDSDDEDGGRWWR